MKEWSIVIGDENKYGEGNEGEEDWLAQGKVLYHTSKYWSVSVESEDDLREIIYQIVAIL